MQIWLHLEESGARVQASLLQGYFGESTKANYSRIPTIKFRPDDTAVEDKTNKLKRITNILLELNGFDMLKPLTTNNIHPRLDACFLASSKTSSLPLNLRMYITSWKASTTIITMEPVHES